jgi:hypothetical protein
LSKLAGPVPAHRRVCRQNSARSQAGRPPGRAAKQVRSRHQSDDRQGARADDPRSVPAARRRGDRVTRREFVTLLGAAAAWPLAARAQQPGRVSRIGVLMAASENDPKYQAFFARIPRVGAGGRAWRHGLRRGREAPSDGLPRVTNSVAIGGAADMPRSRRTRRSDAFDP